MIPNFLIIGAARAGTTWIAKNLSCHPEIFIPKRKELHFFDADYEKGMRFYLDLFDGKNDEKAVGEATPAYLHSKEVPGRIRKHLPDVRLIVCLRDPVERLYSRYWHSKARFAENRNLSFEEKILAKPEFVQEGCYYDHLQNYYRIFPKENLLILLFDDIEKNPTVFLQQICEFLQVDQGFRFPLAEKKINAASSKGLLSRSRLLWYVQKLLERAKLHNLSYAFQKLNSSVIPPIDARTREWLLREYYSEQIDLLESLIGKDLCEWKSLEKRFCNSS